MEGEGLIERGRDPVTPTSLCDRGQWARPLHRASVGATKVLWIDAATFIVSAVAIRISVPVARGDVTSPARGYMEELRDGLLFLWGDRVLPTIMMTVGVTNFLDAATVTLMPVYAQEIYGSSVSLGRLVGAGAGGSVVTALIYAARRDRLPRRRVLAACFTVRLFDTRSSPSSPHLE